MRLRLKGKASLLLQWSFLAVPFHSPGHNALPRIRQSLVKLLVVLRVTSVEVYEVRERRTDQGWGTQENPLLG
jgi:hypothetical protein